MFDRLIDIFITKYVVFQKWVDAYADRLVSETVLAMMWHGGIKVRTSDYRQLVGSTPFGTLSCGYYLDGWLTSQFITNTTINSAVHPSRVDVSSTSLLGMGYSVVHSPVSDGR